MKAVIGYSGLIGSNLCDQIVIDHKYNSSNIEEIKNFEYDIVYCAAPSAVKWKANKHPDEDLNNVYGLINNFKNIKTKKFILFSTVDVYSKFPCSEQDKPDFYDACFYGKNRILLENFVINYFEDHSIIRLPALFGKGLKKNLIYDLLNNNLLNNINGFDKYQWFYLNDLNNIINFVIDKKIKIFNVSSEPLANQDLILNLFPNFKDRIFYSEKKINYDMRNMYYNDYIFSSKEVMEKLNEFISK
jgi:nucleoside-diphosphate-sugar epimerase